MKIVSAFTGLSVNNLEEAKDFYVRILGLDLSSESMGLHFRLPFGGMLFVYEKPDHKAPTHTVLNLVVEDIDDAADELAKKGITFERYTALFPGAKQDNKGILRSPDTTKYGPTIAWFKDPAGNTIALLQN